jgi:hypothetical protein
VSRVSEYVLTVSAYVEALSPEDVLAVIEDANARCPSGVFLRVPDEPSIDLVRNADELERAYRSGEMDR